MNKRTDWVDYAKGIGIILVVYGHLLSSGYHAGLGIPEQFFGFSDSIIYGFHMPLFFLLSGLFVEKSLQKHGSQKYLGNQLRKLVYPYFIWSILQMSAEVIFSNHTHKDISLSDILSIVYQPWGQFWYIYALFLMQFIFVFANRLGGFAPEILVIVGAGLLFFPIQIEVAALTPFSTHFIFFISGILFRKYLWDIRSIKSSFWTIFISFTVLLSSGLYIFTNAIKPTRLASSNHPFYFLYLAIVGVYFCISFSQYLAGKNIFSFLRTLGLYSKQIYLAHMLAGVSLRVILVEVFKLQNWGLHIVLGVLFALIAPIYLQIITKNLNFPYLFEYTEKAQRTLH